MLFLALAFSPGLAWAQPDPPAPVEEQVHGPPEGEDPDEAALPEGFELPEDFDEEELPEWAGYDEDYGEDYDDYDDGGHLPLILTGALAGGAVFMTSAELADAGVNPWVMGGGGAVLGAAVPFLFTLDANISMGEWAYFTDVTLISTFAGIGAGEAIEAGSDWRMWLGLGGGAVGLTVGSLTLEKTDWDFCRGFWVGAAMAQAWFATASITEIAATTSERARWKLSASYLAAAGAGATFGLLTSRLQMDWEATWALAWATGAYLGGFTPGIWNDGRINGHDLGHAALAGQAIGFLGALALGPTIELHPSRGGGLFTGMLLGSGVGLGVGMAVPKLRGAGTYVALQSGAVAGMVTAGLSGLEVDQFDGNDVAFTAALTAGGAAGGWALYQSSLEGMPLSESSPGVGIIAGAGFGMGTGMLLSQLIDIQTRDLVALPLGTSLFGAIGFGAGSLVEDWSNKERAILTGSMAAAGLGLSFWGRHFDLDGNDAGFIAASAVTGAAFGSLLPGYDLPGNTTAQSSIELGLKNTSSTDLAYGMTAGAAGFTIAGILMAEWLEFEPSDTAKVQLNALAAGAGLTGLGMLNTSLDLRLRLGVVHLVGAGAYVGTAFAQQGPSKPRATERHLQMARGAIHGLAHGLLIPFHWREEPLSRELWGGALLGTAAGAATFRVLTAVAPAHDTGDQIEESTDSLLLAGFGGGLGLLLELPPQQTATLTHTLGAAGIIGGYLASPHTEFTLNRYSLFGVGVLAGSFHGAWLPHFRESDPSASERAAGVLAGGALGGALGMGLGQLAVKDAETGIPGLLADLSVSSIPLGYYLFTERDLDGTFAGVQTAVGVSALVGVSLIEQRLEFHAEDFALIALMTGAGATQGVVGPTLWQDETFANHELSGGILIGAGTGMLAGGILSQFADYEEEEIFRAGFAWAGAAGLAGGLGLVGDDDWSADTRFRLFQIAGASGMTLGLLSGATTELSERDYEFATLTTAAFGLQSWSLVPLAVDGRPTSTQRWGGVLAGASGGLLLGLGLGHAVDVDDDDTVEMAAWLAGFHGIGMGIGKLDLGWSGDGRPTAWQVAGGTGLVAAATLPWLTRYNSRAPALILMGLGWGAHQGAWLPVGWHEGDDDPSGDEFFGGVLAGTSLGLLTGMVTSQFVDESETVDVIGEGLFFGTAGHVAGGGLATLLMDNHRGRWGAMELAGWFSFMGGAFLAGSTEYTDGELWSIVVATTVAATLGLEAPALVSNESDRDAENTLGGIMAGAGLGALASGTLVHLLEPDEDDAIETGLFALAGAGVGAGLATLLPDLSPRDHALALEAPILASLILGGIVAPATEHSDADMGLTTFLTLYGATLGGFAPAYRDRPIAKIAAKELWSGAALGAGAGMLSGLAFGQLSDLDGDDVAEAGIGAVAAAMAGAGAGMMASEDDAIVVGAMHGAGALGALGIGLVAPYTEFSWDRTLLGTTALAYGLWNGVGVSLLLDWDDRQVGGAALLISGVGGIGGAYLSQVLELEWEEVLTIFSTSVWGLWIGGWGGAIAEKRIERDLEGGDRLGYYLGATVVGSDLAILLTSFFLEPLTDMPGMRFAWINVAGVGGMLTGLLVGSLVEDVGTDVGIVAGSAGGLVVGTVATMFFDWGSSEGALLHTPPPTHTVAAATGTPHYGAGAYNGFELVSLTPTMMMVPAPATSDAPPGMMLSVIGQFN